MTKIKFMVTGQRLKQLTTPYLVRDSKRHIQLDFEFMTKGWTDCIKTVVFKTCDGVEASKMLNENNSLRLPTKIAAAESFKVSVFGINLTDDRRITTNPVEIILGESGYSEVSEIEEPPPSVYEQILEKLAKMGEIDPEAVKEAVKEYFKNNLISSDEIAYKNPFLVDQTGTVTAALDEAINFVVGNLPDLVKKKHDHANKESVLDYLADANGTLTYKGKEIGSGGVSERPTESIALSNGEFQAYPHSENIISILMWEERIPVGTEIKTIKIKYEGEWIDIHELNILDTVPFVLNMHKCYVDETDTGGYVLAVIGCIGYWGAVMTAIQSDSIEEIEVVYYSEGGVE